MPMPKPGDKESKDDFVERFMGSEAMREEYPDKKQRYAVAMSQWKKRNQSAADKMYGGKK